MNDASRQRIAIMLYAFTGGFADAAGFLLFKTFTGHITGNVVLLAISLAHGEWSVTGLRLLAIVSFLLCTGLGIRLAASRHSASLLFCCQLLLLLPLGLLHAGVLRPGLLHPAFFPSGQMLPWLGVMAFCCSLGLQNGVVTSSLGVNVHSTFLSGDITSLFKAKEMPRSAKQGSAPATRKRRVLLTLVAGFVVGAVCAALLSRSCLPWEPVLLLFPAFLAMLVEVLWRSPRSTT